MKGFFRKFNFTTQLEGQKRRKELISANVDENVDKFKKITNNSADFIYRSLKFNGKKVVLIYINGFVDSKEIGENVVNPIQKNKDKDIKLKDVINVGNIQDTNDFYEMVDEVLSGKTAVLQEGEKLVLLVDCFSYNKRSVTEPLTELVVKGPREAFTESILTNVALIRKRIKSPNLVFENYTIGRETRTSVSLCYLKGIARDSLVDDIKNKLREIETDSIIDSGYIEQFLDQNPLSIFPTISYTEKPDVAAGKILEGRCAIVVDGSPQVLTLPMFFIEAFQAAEDYYIRPLYALIARNLRMLAFVVSVLSPAFYVALTTYHQELLPTTLLFTIASTREGLPFPGMFEIMIMLVVYEILREAGIRMPRTIGPAISIVGALVLGETAVNAGVVGPAVLIIVAFSAIASFVVPQLVDTGFYIRFLLLILGAGLGLYGITIGILGLLIHLSTLRTFGVPYLSPIAPFSYHNNKDTFIRVPLYLMKRRPDHLAGENKIRSGFSKKYVKEKLSDNNYQK